MYNAECCVVFGKKIDYYEYFDLHVYVVCVVRVCWPLTLDDS